MWVFDKKIYLYCLQICVVLLLIFYGCMLYFTDELTTTDAIGGAITTPVLAFFIHLLWIEQKEYKERKKDS